MTAETLVRTVGDFPRRSACLLHLWSAERNVVRRVLDLEIKNQVLRLAVQRLGQARPTKLETCRARDGRTPTAKRAARLAYLRVLQRVVEGRFSRYTVARLTTSMDLERSGAHGASGTCYSSGHAPRRRRTSTNCPR